MASRVDHCNSLLTGLPAPAPSTHSQHYPLTACVPPPHKTLQKLPISHSSYSEPTLPIPPFVSRPPLLFLSALLTLLQSHKHPGCSSNPLSTIAPQGLCTGYSLFLVYCYPDSHRAKSLTCLKSLPRCHLLNLSLAFVFLPHSSSPNILGHLLIIASFPVLDASSPMGSLFWSLL